MQYSSANTSFNWAILQTRSPSPSTTWSPNCYKVHTPSKASHGASTLKPLWTAISIGFTTSTTSTPRRRRSSEGSTWGLSVPDLRMPCRIRLTDSSRRSRRGPPMSFPDPSELRSLSLWTTNSSCCRSHRASTKPSMQHSFEQRHHPPTTSPSQHRCSIKSIETLELHQSAGTKPTQERQLKECEKKMEGW